MSKMFRKVRYPPSTTGPGESVQGGLSVQDVEEGKTPSYPCNTRPGGLSRVACMSKMFRKVRHPPTPPGGPVQGSLSVQDVEEGKKSLLEPPSTKQRTSNTSSPMFLISNLI